MYPDHLDSDYSWEKHLDGREGNHKDEEAWERFLCDRQRRHKIGLLNDLIVDDGFDFKCLCCSDGCVIAVEKIKTAIDKGNNKITLELIERSEKITYPEKEFLIKYFKSKHNG